MIYVVSLYLITSKDDKETLHSTLKPFQMHS